MGTLFHAIFSGAAIGILVLGTGAFSFRLVFGGGRGKVLDPVLWALNINRYVSLSWGIWLNLAVIVAAIAVIAWVVLGRQRPRRT